MTQLAGSKCGKCEGRIIIESDGHYCKRCNMAFCEECFGNGRCPDCDPGLLLQSIASTDKETAQSIQNVTSAKTPQPIDEPHLTMYGATITESQYLKAIRHNRMAWVFMMSFGIAILLIGLLILGANVYFVIVFLVGPLYPVAMKIFPGAKIHGSAIFRKYQSRRLLILSGHKKASKG